MTAPTKRMEDLALGGSDVNPLKSDIELVTLLKKLDSVKKYKSFQRWKDKFLDRLEQFLYEEGMKPAEKAGLDFDVQLNKTVKFTNKVLGFIDKGELSDSRKTVKAALALNEMCNILTASVDAIQNLIPSTSQEEKKRGYTKFHLGAALIRQGFHQYISMKAVEDAVKDIGAKIEDVADKQQHNLFAYYSTVLSRFCDVMADLSMYEIMLKCLELAEAPEVEESSSEEPIEIHITIETPEGKMIQLILEPTDIIGGIKASIAADCEISPQKQVLKFAGKTLDDNDQTIEGVGIEDGAKLTVEPFKVAITVVTMDGEQIALMVDPDYYLSDIKVQLEKESGVPAKNQRLFMNGDELADNNQTAAVYGIQEGSVLNLEPKSMQVTVEMPDGKIHTMEVSPSDTADSLKEKIAEETGMIVPRQVLKFQGKELPSDGTTLKDMGIRDGSALTIEIYKVPITVNTWDGKSIEIMIDPVDYLSEIKCELYVELGVQAQNQRLFMNGEELADNNKRAMDYGIQAGSVLNLEPKSITITVETPDGTKHTMEASMADTPNSLKEKVAKITGMAVPKQVLKFQGKELPKDGGTLKDMGIRDGSALTVEVFRVPITVNSLDGRSLEVLVDPTDYLSDIKLQLEDESGVPAKNQRLFMNGKELEDNNRKAADYGIQAGSVLDLEPNSIQITVETPDGTKHTMEVSPSDTSDSLKEKVAKKTGMAVPKQVLKLQGMELPSDGRMLKKMGVRDGSELTVEVYKVPITVNTMDGKSINVMVDPTESLSAIKCQLEDESGVPANNQLLFMNGNELADNKKMAAEYGIKKGSVLDLLPKSIQITVVTPDGTKHNMEVSLSDTSDSLKERVAKKTGMASPKQLLKLQGKELPRDGTTLKDMGIQEGSELTVEVFKVPITVNTMDGKSIKVMVDPTEALSDIKRQLEDDSGVPAKNQRLFMNGNELTDDKKTAADYGIQRGSVLDLEPKFMNITVETPDGTKHTMEVKPSDTSDSLKQTIAKETGMAVQRQVLKFQGKELPKGGRTLKDVGVREGSALIADIYRIPITVQTPEGKTLSLNVEPSDTIDNIKAMIAKEIGLEAKRQCLKLDEEELKNGSSRVDECGIKAGSLLTVEQVADVIIFVDIKCGTLFGVERDEVVERQVLTPQENNKLDFTEAGKGAAVKEKILQVMKDSPRLGVATQVVVAKGEVDDYELAEAEAVTNKWGVKLKKREKNKKGEEFIFVDPKTGAMGELSRKKFIDTNFITPVITEKGETLKEQETDNMLYDKYITDIRNIFGIKFE